jgi:hypothetical protein
MLGDVAIAVSVGQSSDLEVLLETRRSITKLLAQEATLFARWDANHEWADDGSKSSAYRYARETGLSIAECKRLKSRARKLLMMPFTRLAFASASLSVDRIDLLVRTNQPNVHEAFARDEELLVKLVKTLSYDDAVRALQYWSLRADAEGAEDKAEEQFRNRSTHCSRILDGTVKLDALFDAIGGEIFSNELQRLDDLLFKEDWSEAKELYGDDVTVDKLKRTPAQRRADALVEMAKRSSSAAGGSNKPLMSIVVGDERLKDVLELASGVVLTPGQVIPHLHDMHIESIIFDGKSRTVDVKQQRSFVGALRRALEVRDRHCQHPSGCDEPASKCQGDHILAWSKGGVTVLHNGQLYCGFHNRAKGSGPP